MGIKHKNGSHGFGWYGNVKIPKNDLQTFDQAVGMIATYKNVYVETSPQGYQIGPFGDYESAKKCIEDIHNYWQYIKFKRKKPMNYPDWVKLCGLEKKLPWAH